MQDNVSAGAPWPHPDSVDTAAPDPPATTTTTAPRAAVRNEAIPEVPPQSGELPVGSIPAANAQRAWAHIQAANWRLYLLRFLCAGLAVVVTVTVVPGLGFTGWHWGLFLRISVIFGLLNATLKPLLQLLVLRFIFNTYGIVVIVINAILLAVLSIILDDTFHASRPLAVLFGGLVVGVLGLIFETLLGATPPVLDRDYRERNGLK